MKDSTKNNTSNNNKTKVHRHCFSLTDQQQIEFSRLLLKYNIGNKSKFIISQILNQSTKIVLLDQTSFEYHASLTSLINYFKALGVSYNILVNRSDLALNSQQILKDILQTTIELSKVCQEIIKLTLEFESKVFKKVKGNGS